MCFSKDFPSTSMIRLKSYTVTVCYRGCLTSACIGWTTCPSSDGFSLCAPKHICSNFPTFFGGLFMSSGGPFSPEPFVSMVCLWGFFYVRITQNIRTILKSNKKCLVVAICLCIVICKFSTKSLYNDQIYN